MNIDPLMNIMRREAQKVVGTRASVKKGIVTGYDSTNYCAKVSLMPEGTETGWLPIGSEWAGNGWGLFAPPSIGDMVQVDFDEGDRQSGSITKRFFNDEDRPLDCPSGEFWLVHKSGSLLKFTNDGDVIVDSARDLLATVGRNLEAAIAGNATVTVTGDAAVSAENASITASSDANVTAGASANVTAPAINLGNGGTLLKLVNDTFKALYNSHTHVKTGGTTTDPPVQSMGDINLTTVLKAE